MVTLRHVGIRYPSVVSFYPRVRSDSDHQQVVTVILHVEEGKGMTFTDTLFNESCITSIITSTLHRGMYRNETFTGTISNDSCIKCMS